MDKIIWAGAPKKGLVEANHFPPQVGDHLNSYMVIVVKLHARVDDGDGLGLVGLWVRV